MLRFCASSSYAFSNHSSIVQCNNKYDIHPDLSKAATNSGVTELSDALTFN